MHIQACYTIVALLCVLGFQVNANPFQVDYDPTSFQPLADRSFTRSLRAAKAKSNLKARSMEEWLEHEIDLHYLDEHTHQTSSQFSARVRMSTRLPTVLLEEVEHHINEIACLDSSIQLYFASQEALELAYNELSAIDEFFVITSHEGCNNDGERESHRVSGISLDEGEQLIILSTSPSPWKNTAHFMALDFGLSNEDFELRRHGDLRPRQAASSAALTDTSAASSTAITSESMATASLTSSVSFSNPTTLTTPPTSTYLSAKLTHSPFISQTILPPDTGLGFHGPYVPHFTLVCKNCSLYGSIEVFSGSLTTNLSESSNSTLAAFEYWEHGGFVELLVNDFSAHIELETSIAPSKDLNIWTAHFPPLAFPLFQIPNIAAVGPQLIPQASMGVQIDANLTFTYGFDVTVPNNSSIILVVGNLTNSSITGFPDTKITALPFQAKLDSIDLTLHTGFTPQLLLGATIFDNLGSIGAGVFFDLPSISATFSHVTGVNSTCDPVDPSSPDVIPGGLTNIVPSAVFDVGLIAEAAVSDFDYTIGVVTTYELASYAPGLPTACLAFDARASTFAPATAKATATATATTAGSSGPKLTNGATILVNPITKMLGSMGRLAIVTLSLSLMSAFFASL